MKILLIVAAALCACSPAAPKGPPECWRVDGVFPHNYYYYINLSQVDGKQSHLDTQVFAPYEKGGGYASK